MSMFFEPLESHRAYFESHGQKITFRKGQYFVVASDPSPWVYFLEDGYVQISFSYKEGTDRLLGYFLPGMTFAQSGSFFDDEGGGLEYCSVGKSVAYRIPRQEFLDQLKKDADFNSDYVKSILRNQIYLVERVVYQGEKGMYARCIRWLMFMAKYYAMPSKGASMTIPIPMTQETASNFLHSTRESASVALSKLRKKGLISTHKKQLTIVDVDKLKAELDSL